MNFFNVIFTGLRDWCKDLGLNAIFLMFLSVLIIAIGVTIIVIALSIENRTAKAITKVEEYLTNNPFVTNENIVEFNRLMKKIPRTLRTKWQQYVVNRDKKPSDFFNEEDCIEKPFKTKGFSQALVIFRNFLIALVSLSFIFSACAITSNSITGAIQESVFTPLVIAILGVIFMIIVNAIHNSVRANMYFNFKDMTKLLDRAVTTFPDVVDYEILFTKKEIDNMIPELQEYLRQRAVYEQEQLEKAKENEVEHENYDFSSLGVDGSLVMERAMKECEYYLGNRRKALANIEQLQTEKDMLTKSYDEKNKVSQRKLRDINETLDRLREKLNNTTNKIVGNDIRRQQTEEIKKQQNIEREIEEDNNRYQAELQKVDEQINSKKQDIDNNRHYVEVAFTNEFKAYSDKVYEKLHTISEDQVKDEISSLQQENQTMKSQLEEKDVFIIEKNKLFDEKMELLTQSQNKIDELNAEIKNYEDYKNQVESYLNQKDGESNENAQRLMSLSSENEKLRNELDAQAQRYKDLKKQKVVEIARCFDVNGNEFFYDEEGVPYYLDESNHKNYYYSKNDLLSGNVSNSAPKSRDEMTRLMTENIKASEKTQENENQMQENQKQEDDLIDEDVDVRPIEQIEAESQDNDNSVNEISNQDNWQDLLDDFDDEEENEEDVNVQETPKVDKDWSYEKFWADEDSDENKNYEAQPSEEEKVEDVKEESTNIDKAEDVKLDTKQEENDVTNDVIKDDILDEFDDLAVNQEKDEQLEQVKAEEQPNEQVNSKKSSAEKSPKKEANKKSATKESNTKKAVKNSKSENSKATKKTNAKSNASKTKKNENKVEPKTTSKSKKVNKDVDNGDIGASDGGANVDINFDDFNKELSTALKQVDKYNK